MKTIVDIINMILASVFDNCYIDSNMIDCSSCKKYNYCHVNAALQAVSIAQQTGEYH